MNHVIIYMIMINNSFIAILTEPIHSKTLNCSEITFFDDLTDCLETEMIHDATSVRDCYKKQGKKRLVPVECFGEGIHDSIYTKRVYRKDEMLVHYPYDYSIILHNEHFCDSNPFILFIHPMSAKDLKIRQAIRKTFGSIVSVDNITIKHLFIMGQSIDPYEDRFLEEEEQKYKDIVVYNFQNSFLNVTLNVLLGMKWSLQYCPHTQYFIRSDGDTWVNILNLVRVQLPHFAIQNHKNIYAGFEIQNNKPIRVPQSRYYISNDIYSPTVFPPYPTGCFYIFSMDVIKLFLNASHTVKPVLYFDDVYLGLLNKQVQIPFSSYPYSVVSFNRVPFSSSSFTDTLLAAHRYTPGDLLYIWESLVYSNYIGHNVTINT
ncbi:hypothetical protein WA158_006401 [Blastocystis sp. Blastoise]